MAIPIFWVGDDYAPNKMMLICFIKRQYTVAEDTLGGSHWRSLIFSLAHTDKRLDPDDLIFPRAATRVGPKFQATVANAPDPDADSTAPLGKLALCV